MKTLAYDCGNPVQYVCGHSPAVLFYLLDRHALLAMTMGSKGIISHSLTNPPPVVQSTTGGGDILSPTHARGQQLHPIPWRTPRYIHMCQWRLYRIHPQAHTLYTTRRVMKSDNCTPYRRMYIHWGTCCSRFPYTIPQPQRIQRGTTWTVRQQMRQ